jgi:hypothetical protein
LIKSKWKSKARAVNEKCGGRGKFVRVVTNEIFCANAKDKHWQRWNALSITLSCTSLFWVIGYIQGPAL